MAYRRISKVMALELIREQQARIIDIRDSASYQAGHIDNAELIDDGNLDEFLAQADLAQPLIVCCYHGNMSQGAAEYFSEQGFAESYSLDGGYAGWMSKTHKPT